jgi:hypothetical protein
MVSCGITRRNIPEDAIFYVLVYYTELSSIFANAQGWDNSRLGSTARQTSARLD